MAANTAMMLFISKYPNGFLLHLLDSLMSDWMQVTWQESLPFPLLIIPPANRSYFYSFNSYNLMNVQEFVADHYAGLDIDHYFNGFFFNKIPLLKKLRLREVIAAKILYGGLRSENNPNDNPNQMLFPTTNGVTSTFALNGQPYVEASVGIYNIFSFHQNRPDQTIYLFISSRTFQLSEYW